MKNNVITLFAHKCIYKEGKLYCFAKDINLLFSVELQDGTIELISAVPEENIISSYLFGAVNIWNDQLILAPCAASKIWTYDLISKHWSELSINGDAFGNTGRFHLICTYKNLIYMVGNTHPAILCLDLENNSCDYIEEPYKEMKERHQQIALPYFRTHGVQLDNYLYLASCLDNYVLKFNMETRKHQWIKVGDDNYVYSEIAWDGNNFWLSPRLNCDIVKWDGKENTKILPLPSDLKTTRDTYIWLACYDDNHVLFPCLSHPKSIMIDTQQDSYEILERQYTLYTRLDNGMVINQTTDGILTVKSSDSSEKTYHTTIDIDRLKDFYKEKNRKILDDQTIYHEAQKNELLSFENYLSFVVSDEPTKPTSNIQTGKTIWEAIR